jgi:hypothetical protein
MIFYILTKIHSIVKTSTLVRLLIYLDMKTNYIMANFLLIEYIFTKSNSFITKYNLYSSLYKEFFL